MSGREERRREHLLGLWVDLSWRESLYNGTDPKAVQWCATAGPVRLRVQAYGSNAPSWRVESEWRTMVAEGTAPDPQAAREAAQRAAIVVLDLFERVEGHDRREARRRLVDAVESLGEVKL